MEREKNQLLELTRCSLWGRDIDTKLFEGGVRWATLLQLAQEQTLLGVISVSIEQLPPSLQPKKEQIYRLH